jgi:hypothetical protein
VIDTRVGKLEATIKQQFEIGQKATSPGPDYSANELSADDAARFLRTCPMSLNILAYACTLAYTLSKPLDLDALCTAIGTRLTSFYRGALSAMDAMHLIDRDPTETPGSYKFNYVHKYITDNAESYFVSYLSRQYASPDDATEKARWLTQMAAVKSLYRDVN